MTSLDQEADTLSARHFERLLLESARADELPGDVSGAWLRLGAALGGAAGVGAPLSLAVSSGAAALRRAARRTAAKWLVLGALGGGALTALGMSHGRAWLGARPAPVSSAVLGTPAASSVMPPPLTVASEPVAGLPEPMLAAPHVRVAAGRTESAPRAHATARRAGSDSNVESSGASSSTLGAQVALLDAARTAISAGAFGEALGLTAQYRRDFPAGELTPDAEVVALEALAGRGDRAALEARAARFLARYPADPHAARVKALAER